MHCVLPSQSLCSAGTYGWSGAGGTFFWIDPATQIVVVFMTQVMQPDPTVPPLQSLIETLVYAALVEGHGSKL